MPNLHKSKMAAKKLIKFYFGDISANNQCRIMILVADHMFLGSRNMMITSLSIWQHKWDCRIWRMPICVKFHVFWSPITMMATMLSENMTDFELTCRLTLSLIKCWSETTKLQMVWREEVAWMNRRVSYGCSQLRLVCFASFFHFSQTMLMW